MKKTTSRNGFTLIELIIVMVILGIMAAVAVPRYLDSIANAEESAEDAVISAVRNGLKQYANNSLLDNGRATWPTDPFSALSEKPAGHTEDGDLANEDGEWTSSIMAMVQVRSHTRERTIAAIPGTMTLVHKKMMTLTLLK
jgi:prepilin-type N-terminal cleavage/methylation domain-containing protein